MEGVYVCMYNPWRAVRRGEAFQTPRESEKM